MKPPFWQAAPLGYTHGNTHPTAGTRLMASRAKNNDRYRKQKRKRLQRFALQMAQDQAGRACDGCTACCFVMGVAEVPTPFYSPCPHIRDGGCDIYGKHPGACRDFYCEWLVGRLGDDDR